MLASSLRRAHARVALVRFASIGSDVVPMSIADRVELDYKRAGKLDELPLRGRPLPDEPDTQAALPLPKNMEMRAEAEMRRGLAAGLLENLAGEGSPLPDRHAADSSLGHAAMQAHARQANASPTDISPSAAAASFLFPGKQR